MAQYTGEAELDGLLKNVYGEKGPVDLIPKVGLINKKPIKDAEKQGLKFVQNVIVAQSHGFTYNNTSQTAYVLNDSISMTTQEAEISATEVTLRDALTMRVASRSAGGNKRAFKSATELLLYNMTESHRKRQEIMYWYGRSKGIGQTASTANSTATVTVGTITSAEWAAGIWAGMENAKVQFYKNTDDTLISTGADSIFTVTAVNSDERKITFTGTATGITALDSAGAACNIFFLGAHGEEAYGLHAILQNTGTLFGIDAAVYGLWRANAFDCGSAALTMSKVLKGLSRASDRGLEGKVSLVLCPLTWSNLASDLAALRKYDGSYKRSKLDNGTEAITYYSQNGEIEIVSLSIIKRGYAYALPMDQVSRLGSTDLTYDIPGYGGRMFRLLDDRSGFEIRNYSDTCVFFQTPAQGVIFTGIVNNEQ